MSRPEPSRTAATPSASNNRRSIQRNCAEEAGSRGAITPRDTRSPESTSRSPHQLNSAYHPCRGVGRRTVCTPNPCGLRHPRCSTCLPVYQRASQGAADACQSRASNRDPGTPAEVWRLPAPRHNIPPMPDSSEVREGLPKRLGSHGVPFGALTRSCLRDKIRSRATSEGYRPMATSQHPRYCRAVVAGGAGLLGSHLCDALLRAGSEVIRLDNLSTGSASNIQHLVGGERFRFLECDVTDAIKLPGTVDLVLDFASPASPVDYLRLPIETLTAGSVGTKNLPDVNRNLLCRHAPTGRRKMDARWSAPATSWTAARCSIQPLGRR